LGMTATTTTEGHTMTTIQLAPAATTHDDVESVWCHGCRRPHQPRYRETPCTVCKTGTDAYHGVCDQCARNATI